MAQKGEQYWKQYRRPRLAVEAGAPAPPLHRLRPTPHLPTALGQLFYHSLALCTNHVEARVAQQIFSGGMAVFGATRYDNGKKNSSPQPEDSAECNVPAPLSASSGEQRRNKDDGKTTEAVFSHVFEVEGSQPRIAQTRESISPPPQLQQQHYCERATLQRQEEDLYAQAARDAASGKDGLCQSGSHHDRRCRCLGRHPGPSERRCQGGGRQGRRGGHDRTRSGASCVAWCSAAVEPSFVALAPPTVSSAAGETERDGGSPTEAVATAFDSAAGEDATASGAPASAPALAPPAALSGKAETGKAETETEGRAEKRARPPRAQAPAQRAHGLERLCGPVAPDLP